MFFNTLFKNAVFPQRAAVILAFILICCTLLPSFTLAETSTLSIGKTAITTKEAINMVDAVLSVMSRLSEEQEGQRSLRNRMSAKDLSSDELKEIESSLANKHVAISNLKEDIDNVFTGINVKELKRRKAADFDWSKDVQEIFFPLFTELKSLTDRPREMARLRQEISFLQNRRLIAVDKAIFMTSALLQKLPAIVVLANKFKKNKTIAQKLLKQEIAKLEDELEAEERTDKNLTKAEQEKLTIKVKNLKDEISATELKLISSNAELTKLISRIAVADQLTVLLNEEKKKWKELRGQASDELTVSSHRLNEINAAKSPFLETMRTVLTAFFTSSGRNLVVAVFFALGFGLLFKKFHKRVLLKAIKNRQGNASFFIRLVNLFFHGVAFVGSILVFQFVLYFFDDWILLGLTVVFILAIVWLTAKELPSMWHHIQLLLNFGIVRDGERVVIDGIPWEVDKINLFTRLKNPWLTGGTIRLPLTELQKYRSRAAGENEIWFPSREGDWVLLKDGTFGKVKLQTPEMVELETYGGCEKCYPMANYLNQIPKNMSKGFCVAQSFGLDYTLKDKVTEEIPEIMTAYLRKLFTEAGYMENTGDLKVCYCEVNKHSLVLKVLSTYNGEIAGDYYPLQRLIQKGALDCACENNWEMPFRHYSIHTEEV